MTRLSDWDPRLAEYLASAFDRPHEYGVHDCALHGANAVHAMTGIDHGAPFRGKYTTEIGAAIALRKYGEGSLEATFDSHLSVISPAMAKRGDLVMAGDSVGVCIGGDAVFVGMEGERDGLVRIPRRDWTKAWAV